MGGSGDRVQITATRRPEQDSRQSKQLYSGAIGLAKHPEEINSSPQLYTIVCVCVCVCVFARVRALINRLKIGTVDERRKKEEGRQTCKREQTDKQTNKQKIRTERQDRRGGGPTPAADNQPPHKSLCRQQLLSNWILTSCQPIWNTSQSPLFTSSTVHQADSRENPKFSMNETSNPLLPQRNIRWFQKTSRLKITPCMHSPTEHQRSKAGV